MGRKITISVCTLQQWSMDFDGNCQRILDAVHEAKLNKSKYILCPELCIPGYGCQDHFFESDTILHSFEVLAKLLLSKETEGIICDVGMPLLHKNVRYNCRIIFTYKKILLIRPKKDMANEECYRELRWFTPWKRTAVVEDHYLPRMIQKITDQEFVSFGDGVISTEDTCIGSEICEELWNPVGSATGQSLDGVEIFTNSSGSHHQLNKAAVRVNLIKQTTYKCGGVYMFANQQGCDGDRLYYDGYSMIAVNGEIVAHGSQFSFREVQVLTTIIDLEDIRSYRGDLSSRSISCELKTHTYPRIKVKGFSLSPDNLIENISLPTVKPIVCKFLTSEQEIALGPASWLWDYLRRSEMSGYFLPLSGGVDSASVACIVFSMCKELYIAVECGNKRVVKDLRKIVNDETFQPKSTQDICSKLFTTCYMATENSSAETKKRAVELAACIGSNHVNSVIDVAVNAFVQIFISLTGFVPKYKVNGGSDAENIALQNIQARTRMVLAYLLAGLLPWTRGQTRSLLVLGSSNVDECLRGYFTKYDCSSADLNPIGSISKTDLRLFLQYAYKTFGFEPLRDILQAAPTAELVPLKEGSLVQMDEAEMGMTYDELSVFGTLRKFSRCGPYSMFCKLLHKWKGTCSPTMVSDKVKHFFKMYGINRHKMTTLTPSYHAAGYSPDDNRFDLRPFLYNPLWTWQFRRIDDTVESLNDLSKTLQEVD